MNEHIVDIDETNAQALLIEESHKRPVVVDFWADWCEPCKTLMPLLEKITTEYDGAFLLAKVNADTQQMIAQQFGVRSLPTVMVIHNGQPVDGFMGAQPETAVRELLQKYLPAPWDPLLKQASDALEQGDFAAAVALLRQAYEESGQQHDVMIAYVHALIEAMRLDDAEAVLATGGLADQDAAFEQLSAQLQLKREAAKSPEMAALEAAVATDPDDADSRVKLAVQYTTAGQYRDALENLYTVLKADTDHDNGATKKLLLDTIASIGKGDPLAAEYQRKLFSLLY